MPIEDYPNISEIFSLEWFEDGSNNDHPLYILNNEERYDIREYFEFFDNNLSVIIEHELLSKDLKNKLLNPTQFEDTLIEVQVASVLLERGIDIELPDTFPDINIPDFDVIIEVKNLHTSEKFLDSSGKEYAVEIDDIKRIWGVISEKILHKLDDIKTNLILINVPPIVDFDEFIDLLIHHERSREGGVSVPIDVEKMEDIPDFSGEFAHKSNENISAVIMMKNGGFRGILNPYRRRDVPDILMEFFRIENFVEFTGQ